MTLFNHRIRTKPSTKTSLLFWLLAGVLLSGCEQEHTEFPDYDVYLRRQWVNENLIVAGDKKTYITQTLSSDRLGYGGLVVVYCYDELEPLCAFDLACPNCVSPTIRVSEPDDLLVSTCPNCGERYDLFYGLGVPLEGISPAGMKKYSTYIDPGNDQYFIVSP